MKANAKSDLTITWLTFLILTVLTVFLTKSVHAQRPMPLPRTAYFGVMATTGNRTFQLKNSAPNAPSMNVLQHGVTVGLMGGIRNVTARVQAGQYQSAANNNATVKSETLTGCVDISPMEWLTHRRTPVQPYGAVGIDFTTMQVVGLMSPGNPRGQESHVEMIRVVRVEIGAGVRVRVCDQRHFVSMSGQIKCGLPLENSSSNSALSHTIALHQIGFDFGVTVGLVRRRTHPATIHVRYR